MMVPSRQREPPRPCLSVLAVDPEEILGIETRWCQTPSFGPNGWAYRAPDSCSEGNSPPGSLAYHLFPCFLVRFEHYRACHALVMESSCGELGYRPVMPPGLRKS